MRKRLGRLHAPDDRDQKFAVKVARTTGRKMWDEGRIWLPQPEIAACVGFAAAHWLLCLPVSQFTHPLSVYEFAQERDEWQGTPHEGTSVRAGAKVLQTLRTIERYEWAFTVEAIVSAVLDLGPVIVGANWYAGMDSPREGRWRVKGRNLGGHAWLLTGVDTAQGEFRTRNSHYGNARGFLAIEDMARLLAEEGEACLAVERKAAPS